mmetsp:Transcript_18245/g.32729  ORF Transcript_18245/g.32729 Transcript_18245/m.32729 type:complete len:215 (-) Transcript_18245:2562-3206(-)
METPNFQTKLLWIVVSRGYLQALQKRLLATTEANDSDLLELKRLKEQCSELDIAIKSMSGTAHGVVEGNLITFSKKRVSSLQAKMAEAEVGRLVKECSELKLEVVLAQHRASEMTQKANYVRTMVEDMERENNSAKIRLHTLKLAFYAASKPRLPKQETLQPLKEPDAEATSPTESYDELEVTGTASKEGRSWFWVWLVVVGLMTWSLQSSVLI